MPDSRRTIGVVLAGGTGSRVGLSIPKQLLKVAGKPVMEHTLGIFQDCDAIDEIYILMHPDHLEAARRIGSKFSKVTQVLAGGETRNDSTKAALRVLGNLNDADTRVMFHDAVRPLLDTRIINDCFAALDAYDAVDVAIPSADTIIEVNERRDHGTSRRGASSAAARRRRPSALGVIREAYAQGVGGPRLHRDRRLHGGAALLPGRADHGGRAATSAT